MKSSNKRIQWIDIAIGIEGDIIRKNVIHIMIMLILVSLVTMLIIYLFKKFANSLQEKLNNRRISS